MEAEKAINNLNFIIVTDVYDNEVRIDKTKVVNEYNESVGIVLQQLTKQEKMIELMAEYLEDKLTYDICNKENCYADEYINGHCQKCLNCIKQYFENKANEEAE